MSRYIDAETIPDLFNEKFKETRKLIEAGETQLDNLAEGFTEAEKIVLFKAPTADVQEMKYGKWLRTVPTSTWSYRRVCSLCGQTANMIRTRYTYCPWCGAKMDGGESE